jgi:hypothetical protein
MTHDELLAKINNLPEVIDLATFKVRHNALIAVIELHRPMPLLDDCYGCQQADPYLNKVYPCETIEIICDNILAIEKEF